MKTFIDIIFFSISVLQKSLIFLTFSLQLSYNFQIDRSQNQQKSFVIQITNTEFKIEYEPFYFNFDKFLRNISYEENQQQSCNLDTNYNYNLLYDQLNYSCQYEGEPNYTQDQYEKIQNYLKENKIPQISDFYKLLFPQCEQVLRKDQVFINPMSQTHYWSCSSMGIDYKDLNLDDLQNFVDYYYNNKEKIPFYMSYVFYLFYERIHPHIDGNGRMGRLMFIENQSDYKLYPLSQLLIIANQMGYKQDINAMYQLFDKPKQIPWEDYTVKLQYTPFKTEEYYYIYLKQSDIKKIIHIICNAYLIKYYQNTKYIDQLILNPFIKNKNFKEIIIHNKEEILEQLRSLQ